MHFSYNEARREVMATLKAWRRRELHGETGVRDYLWRSAIWGQCGLDSHEKGNTELARHYFVKAIDANDGKPEVEWPPLVFDERDDYLPPFPCLIPSTNYSATGDATSA